MSDVTTRGLVDSDIGPLRRFYGILDSYPTEQGKTYGEGEKARATTRININFKDIDVKEAVEPYHFPTFTIQINLSDRKKSRWGVFSLSLNTLLDKQYTPEQLDPKNPNYVKDKERITIKDCVGRRIGLVMADGEDGRPTPPDLFDGRAGEDKPTPTWAVFDIEGVGTAGENAVDIAESLLDGKTLAQFNKEALANEKIRGDTELLQQIGLPPTATASFTNLLLKMEKFTKDENGVFHKKQ